MTALSFLFKYRFMTNILHKTLAATPVVPLVSSDDPAIAVKTTRALVAGGLNVIEVVLRTDAAMDCLEAICKEVPEAITGAGTVLTGQQATEAVRRGATFIVSPGLTQSVVHAAEDAGVPLLAGIVTATELQNAYNYGLRTVKFFPAGLSGGPKMLKAFSSVFRDVQFMPTGGVSAANLPDYLAVPSVLACGGSWLTPADAIAAGDFNAITALAKEAVEIAKKVRG